MNIQKKMDTKLTSKLLDLMDRTGYPIVQHNGQRKFGPPLDWSGPPPPKGCEVFVGKLPRDVYEDELVPIFSTVGKIYEMRLMMDFSGSNRGYSFVTYVNRAAAHAATKQLNGFQIRPGRRIGVVKSVDNCKLFIGSIPKTKSKEEIYEELSKYVTDIVDVIVYRNCYDKEMNRGFAFVEFTSHRAAAMARRSLVPGCAKLWDREINVDWAEPEPEVDEEQMLKVKVLYARNFLISTTPDRIRSVFENAIETKIERVKKIYNYAFIHFFERKDAERAIAKLQNVEIDGSLIEICWAKPVVRELYKVQKQLKGNAKFNSSNLTFSQTLMLYKLQLQKKEFTSSRDEGFVSACAGESTCGSPTFTKPVVPYCSTPVSPPQDNYAMAPAKLESMCKRFMWAAPVYNYQKFVDSASGAVVWSCRIELPSIGQPLTSQPLRLGPYITTNCFSFHQARIEAAQLALQSIKVLQVYNQTFQQRQSMLPIQPATFTTIPPSFSSYYDPLKTAFQTPILPVSGAPYMQHG